MRKFAKFGNKISLIAFLSVAVIILSVADAEAASGIFEKMRSKVATTLRDLRMLIYVVGGIGLITFTFAAIFGKISFKHLANICISLFLVSMIAPFVTFFTGDNTALKELSYGNYLSTSNGTAADDTVKGSCAAGACPQSAGDGTGIGGNGTFDGGTLAGVTVVGKKPGLGSLVQDPTKIDPSSININVPTSATEVDTRTGWQKFKDGIKKVASEGKKAYNTASSAYTAAKNVKTAVDNGINAGKNVKNAMKNIGKGGNFGEKLANLMDAGGAVMDAGGVLSNSVQNVTGNVQNVAATVGENYTDKKKQDQINSEIEKLRKDSKENPDNVEANNKKIAQLQEEAKNSTAGAKVGAALDGINDVAKEGRDVTGTGGDIFGTGASGARLGTDILNGKGLKF